MIPLYEARCRREIRPSVSAVAIGRLSTSTPYLAELALRRRPQQRLPPIARAPAFAPNRNSLKNKIADLGPQPPRRPGGSVSRA